MNKVLSPEEPVRSPVGDSTKDSVLSEAISLGMKKVVNMNTHEACLGGKRQKNIETLRRYAVSQIDREEKEIKQSLTRLHEQRDLTRVQDQLFQDDHGFYSEYDSSSLPPDSQSATSLDDHVINPYPITFPVRKISVPSKLTNRTREKESTHERHRRSGCRRVSVEFEDLGIQSTTGKLLPPLHSVATKSSSRLSTVSGRESLRRAGSVSPVRCGSAVNRALAAPGEAWAGDPCAIGSVRRPRKTPKQQRLDVISRSNSVRENNARKVLRRWQNLSRSCSMREGPTSQLTASPRAGDGFSHRRAKSLKETRRRHKNSASEEPLSESLSVLDLHRGQCHKSHQGHEVQGQIMLSRRPVSSLTRTKRWLQAQPPAGSLQSSATSLRNESSSGHPVEDSTSSANMAAGSRVDDVACAVDVTSGRPINKSGPITIQHPLSRDPSLLLRRRFARRGHHPLESPPSPLPPLMKFGDSPPRSRLEESPPTSRLGDSPPRLRFGDSTNSFTPPERSPLTKNQPNLPFV